MNAYTAPGILETQSIINAAAAEVWGVPVELLFTKTRKREILEPRQVIQYYRYIILEQSPTKIGRETNVDESTIFNSAKTIANLLETDQRLNRKYKLFKGLL